MKEQLQIDTNLKPGLRQIKTPEDYHGCFYFTNAIEVGCLVQHPDE